MAQSNSVRWLSSDGVLNVRVFLIKRGGIKLCNLFENKVFRILVSAYKISQHTPQRAYGFVPLQDFTKSWTDEELYSVYNRISEEINFIESIIKLI